MSTLANSSLPALNRSYAERKRRLYADVERMLANGGDNEDAESAKRARLVESMPAMPRIICVPPLEPSLSQHGNDDDATHSSTSTSLTRSAPLPYQGIVCVGARRCAHCHMAPTDRFVDAQHNVGLLHTLYSYGDFFAELFKIYERRLAFGRSSSEIRDSVATLMGAYNLSHRSRPMSLRVPFEQGLKNNSYIHFNGWLCPAVTRALSLATVVLTSERRGRNYMTGINFHQNVVLPTLVYLHEALSRRAKSKKTTNFPLRLSSIQDEVSQHDDVFLAFLTSTSVKDAEKQCNEFSASQFAQSMLWNVGKHPNTYVMEEMPEGVMGALQTVLNSYKDGELLREDTEDAFCKALYVNGRSGIDYMMPGQTPVKPQPWHAIRRGTDLSAHFVDTPPLSSSTTPLSARAGAPLIDSAFEDDIRATLERFQRSEKFADLMK